MKTPPDRSGITFEVGAQLEARDRQKNWYAATIERIDYDQERVLIHYRHWSRRHDEWFPWNSPRLRALERVSLRRQGRGPPQAPPMFGPGSKVLACWTDCRFYPAKILRVNRDDSYTVRFFDGVVRTVKPAKVKPFQKRSRSERSAVGSEGWEEGESEEEKLQEEGPPDQKNPAESESDLSEASSAPGRGGAHQQPITADPALPSPPHVDRDLLLERQAHLPTTHKFSREPLYRVIKNQPPPILSIELDHNPFKCPAPACSKSFRKASLLHSHIKYYHQQLEPAQARRKRSSSEGGDFPPGKSSSCYHDDREQSIMGADLKKEGGKRRAGGPDRKERKHFLRVKLKKKKKKKKKKKNQSGVGSSDEENSDRPLTLKLSHPHVDEGSDWSTLTAESGEDTPPWPVAMETEELVRCVCEVDEENDFMIQCESCLCWQHGACMGLYEDNVPHNYVCHSCRPPAGWRRGRGLRPDADWLVSGHMFGLSCVRENYSERNASRVGHTGALLATTLGLGQLLRALQLKLSLLRSPAHPDLQLWRLPWRPEEAPRAAGGARGEAPACYVRSEHCYQKPGASWEKEAQQQEMTPNPNPDAIATGDAPPTAPPTDVPPAANGDSRPPPPPSAPPLAPAFQCQLNLLEHVETLHQQISARMDAIERELDVLESWLDTSGELEPPDPLSRLPQLKQRIRRLLSDLCVVRRLSACR
ncbi:LOW QUALITY PROTEIN: PHD finger protein 20-like [Menidia menidia]